MNWELNSDLITSNTADFKNENRPAPVVHEKRKTKVKLMIEQKRRKEIEVLPVK